MNEIRTEMLDPAEVLAEVEELLGESACSSRGAAVELRPLDPATAVARLVGCPVRITRITYLLTDKFAWVQYKPYEEPDPVALAPLWDFGPRFEAALGAVTRTLTGSRRSGWAAWYTVASRQVNTVTRRWLPALPLDAWERDLVAACLERWVADPRNLDRLVRETTWRPCLEPPPVPVAPVPVTIVATGPGTRKAILADFLAKGVEIF